MAHDDDGALLSAWIEQVGRMPAEPEGPDERSYKAVALELGLTEDDLARVEAAVEAHLARGRNYLSHGRAGDAVGELKQARTLAPWRPDITHALAEAHAARFEAGRDEADREAARALIRGRLDHDPDHQPSYALLNRLDRGPTAVVRPGAAARRRMLLASAGGVLLILALSGMMAALMGGGDGPRPAPPPSEAPEAPVDPGLPRGTFDLPVEVVSWDKFDGITLDAAGSALHRSASASARVALRVRNTLDGQGLDALAGTLEFLDDDGAVVTQERIELLNSTHAMLYPGEQQPYGRAFRVDPSVARARLILETLRRKSAAEPPESEPICVRWAVDRPDHLDLDFGLRGLRWGLGTLHLDLTVRNRGANAVENLVFSLEHLDADDRPIAETNTLDKETVAASWLPPFEPGELRLARHIKVLRADDKPRYDHTCLRITQAD